jgi:hypothetical protein
VLILLLLFPKLAGGGVEGFSFLCSSRAVLKRGESPKGVEERAATTWWIWVLSRDAPKQI